MHSYVFLYPFWVTCIRVSELADRGWGPRICIPHKPPSDADAAGRGITLGEQLLSAKISKSVAMNQVPQCINRFLPGKYPAESRVYHDRPFITAPLKNSVTGNTPYF